MKSGIKELANIIECLKKKKTQKAVNIYQEYSRLPKLKAEKYIEKLEEDILKGNIDIGKISDKDLKLFNKKPTTKDKELYDKEQKDGQKGCFIILGIIGVWFIISLISYINNNYIPNKVIEVPNSYYDIIDEFLNEDYYLGKQIFLVKSKHHKNAYYFAVMVYSSNDINGTVYLWAKTGDIDNYSGNWTSMNNLPTDLPNNKFGWRTAFDASDCCAKAVKKHTQNYYLNNP